MLGRYRIERELGRGGMGVVYVATDENTGRLVALKTTMVAGLGSGEKTRNQRRERFVREVRALTQMNHENVVHVFDAGECDDPDMGWLLFYTMEYVEGTTLAALVQEQGALQGGEAAAVVMQVAAGLGEAHAQGIIHRDVKPANIFLSVDGRAKIGDFGIAKIEGSTQITRRDQLVGTPNYLAPEQITGDVVTPATDVFALGALFFVITQNRPLRQQVDAAALLASANGNDPVQRVHAVDNLSEGLKRAVARALERDPARRYLDGTAFADALVEHATRIPPLRGSPARADFLSEGTSDRSSAFIDSGRGDESMPDANAFDIQSLPDVAGDDVDSIEAVAAAMLGEVERRATGTFRQPPLAPTDSLPVARTESTVMFNLRALEEERSAKGPASPSSTGAAPLPVARTESTGSFRVPEASPTKARIELEPLADERSASASYDGPSITSPVVTPAPARLQPKGGWEEATHESAAVPVSPSDPLTAELPAPPTLNDTPRATPSRAFGPRAVTGAARVPSGALRAAGTSSSSGPSRGVLMAACFAAGTLLGFGLAFALAPPSIPTVTVPEHSGGEAAPQPGGRPSLCPQRSVTPEEQAQAAAFLDEARAMRRDGESSSKVLDRLSLGIAKDPTNHLLFYELGRVSSAAKEQDIADECVCRIARDSKECATVEKARGH